MRATCRGVPIRPRECSSRRHCPVPFGTLSRTHPAVVLMSTLSESLRKLIRLVGHMFGVEVRRYRPKAGRLGINPMADIRTLLAGIDAPIVFDVGANVGQSVRRFSRLLPGCEVYAFEPAPSAFAQLQQNVP